MRAPGKAAASLVVALVLCSVSIAAAQGAYSPSAFRAGAAVDANRLGDAVVAWNGPTGVRAVLGDRLGGFTPVWQLSAAKDTWGSPQAAIDARGDAIVVWETYRESGGASARPASRGWCPPACGQRCAGRPPASAPRSRSPVRSPTPAPATGSRSRSWR